MQSVFLSLSVEPDGPPMDVTLQAVTSQSIRVTWKVNYFDHLSEPLKNMYFLGVMPSKCF